MLSPLCCLTQTGHSEHIKALGHHDNRIQVYIDFSEDCSLTKATFISFLLFYKNFFTENITSDTYIFSQFGTLLSSGGQLPQPLSL